MALELAHGDPGRQLREPREVRLGEYLREWLESVGPNLSGSERYGHVEQHLIPAIGGLAWPSCGRRTFSSSTAAGRSPARTAAALVAGDPAQTPLRPPPRSARRRPPGYIAVNPADASRRRTISGEKKAIQVLSEAQTAELLRRARDPPPPPILVAVTSGLRRGELLALRWSDIDFKAGCLRVEQAVEETGAGCASRRPRRPGRRRVPLPELTVDALRRHKVEQDAERLHSGRLPGRGRPRLRRPRRAPVVPLELRAHLADVQGDAAGRLQIRFHDLRHTHASQLLAKGVHPKVVSERLGHASVGITLDTYSHLLPGLQEEAVKRLEATLAVALADAC